MRLVSVLLLLFGVEFIVAAKPFDGNDDLTEAIFLLAGVTLLSIWHTIMWDRSE